MIRLSTAWGAGHQHRHAGCFDRLDERTTPVLRLADPPFGIGLPLPDPALLAYGHANLSASMRPARLPRRANRTFVRLG